MLSLPEFFAIAGCAFIGTITAQFVWSQMAGALIERQLNQMNEAGKIVSIEEWEERHKR